MSWEVPEALAATRFEERVVVAAFTHLWEAELARARLASEGVAAVLGDANLVRLHWFVSHAVGGVKLLVAESDVALAGEILRHTAELPELGLATDSDGAADPACPRCHSANLTYERFSRGGFVATLLLLGFPLPFPRPRWRCGRCKAIWRPGEVAG